MFTNTDNLFFKIGVITQVKNELNCILLFSQKYLSLNCKDSEKIHLLFKIN